VALFKSGIHPLRISEGYRRAKDIALRFLRHELSISIDVDSDGDAGDSESSPSEQHRTNRSSSLYNAATNVIKSSLSRVITPSSSLEDALIDHIADIVMLAVKRTLSQNTNPAPPSIYFGELAHKCCEVCHMPTDRCDCHLERIVQDLRRKLQINVVIDHIEGRTVRETKVGLSLSSVIQSTTYVVIFLVVLS